MVLGKHAPSMSFSDDLINFPSFAVNVNIVDEERKTANSYDPQAPITRKGVLTCLRSRRQTEIKERDVVNQIEFFLSYTKFAFDWNLIFRFQLGRCRLVTEFEKLNRIGEGTYGVVCKFNRYQITESKSWAYFRVFFYRSCPRHGQQWQNRGPETCPNGSGERRSSRERPARNHHFKNVRPRKHSQTEWSGRRQKSGQYFHFDGVLRTGSGLVARQYAETILWITNQMSDAAITWRSQIFAFAVHHSSWSESIESSVDRQRSH